MIPVNEKEVWHSQVLQMEVGDKVLGGDDGPINQPLKALTNRTAFLKALASAVIEKAGLEIGRFDDAGLLAAAIEKIVSGGCAASAAKLKTPRYINGIAFDGSSDINATPAGAVQYFAMQSAPVGWLKANGAEVSRATYANLFAAIGTHYGVGDGATTFNLPDLRGEFLRGLDEGRGIDLNRSIGTFQGDALRSHSHSFGVYRSVNAGIGDNINGGAELSAVGVGGEVFGGAFGGNETRPRNIALLACIKI